MRTNIDFYRPVMTDLLNSDFDAASLKLTKAKEDGEYQEKDRVLYYLDNGSVFHYAEKYNESNLLFEEADMAMEELFTKSISNIATSYLLNDNALEYYGEVYENLYVNIFKAINYLKLNKFDEAYVEIKRVNDKLNELNLKYEKMVDELNNSDENEVKFEKKAVHFYDDALAQYLSYLIFRTDNENDDARISFEKMTKSMATQSAIYPFRSPSFITDGPQSQTHCRLNVIAFSGNGPTKIPIGGSITTWGNFVTVTDVSGYKNGISIPFPGIESGYHFKFSFPQLQMHPSNIAKIKVLVNNKEIGEVELLENLGLVAKHTFESHLDIIYLKTILRTVVKGLAAAEAKAAIKKQTGANDLFSALINIATDLAVDATENADLRCWHTMPQKCFVGEFDLEPGKYDISIHFLANNGQIIKKVDHHQYNIKNNTLNLVEAVALF
jgi:hypothetical protein